MKLRRQQLPTMANPAANQSFTRKKGRRWQKPGTTSVIASIAALAITCLLFFTVLHHSFKKYHHVSSEESHHTITKLDRTNILSSRNWHRMATCETVPDAYYTLEGAESWCTSVFTTECKHSIKDMVEWFQSCQGTIWIRLQSSKDGDLDTFIQHVLPKMKHEFDLITTDGDTNVDLKNGGRSLLTLIMEGECHLYIANVLWIVYLLISLEYRKCLRWLATI